MLPREWGLVVDMLAIVLKSADSDLGVLDVYEALIVG